jgi:hypothetical protein
MPLQLINIGELPNDGTGDPLRVAFQKINDNFQVIPSLSLGGPNGALQYNNNTVSGGNANLVVNIQNNSVNTNYDLIPITTEVVDLGKNTNRFRKLWLAKEASLNLGNISVTETNDRLYMFRTRSPSVGADLDVRNIFASGDIVATGNLTLSGQVSFQGGLDIQNINLSTELANTVNNTANQVVYSTSLNTFNSIRFHVTSTSIVSQDKQAASINVTKRGDGLTIQHVVFGTMFIGNVLTRYNVDLNQGNMRLMVSPIPNFPMLHSVSFLKDRQ